MKKKHTVRTVNLLLILAILVLVNLVAGNTFVKFDLTSTGAYSLSQISSETLARIEDPLRVKVFYSSDVPAPYNGVRQYLLDLLVEYQSRANRLFSYEVVDTAQDEGRQAAQQYGLAQVQIHRKWQLGSSSPALELRWPGGSVLLVSGNPFAGGIAAIESALHAHGIRVS